MTRAGQGPGGHVGAPGGASGGAPGGVKKRITVLGATGSVGRQTLDLVATVPETFAVEALTAQTNVELLAQRAQQCGARLAVIGDGALYGELKDALSGTGIAAAAGPGGLLEAAAAPADLVMAAIVGAAGLEPALAAVRRGVCVALANKECLVCAGEVFMAQVAASGATLLPVDSEHNAIFQILRGLETPGTAVLEAVERIVFTASGGPFLRTPAHNLKDMTPQQAVRHPVWNMGAKISVDSATLMNKGLELIEAHWLFGADPDRLDVLIHPQSVVHAMVHCADGSVLAHMGPPDMRVPIAHALAWPVRMRTPVPRLDLAQLGTLTFAAVDAERFPALDLARRCLQTGRGAPTILNAANEVAVAAFLAMTIGFSDIIGVILETLSMAGGGRTPGSVDDVIELDRSARARAVGIVAGRAW